MSQSLLPGLMRTLLTSLFSDSADAAGCCVVDLADAALSGCCCGPDDTHNLHHGQTTLPMFRCPSDSSQDAFTMVDSGGATINDSGGNPLQLAISNYVGIIGYGSLSMTRGNPAGKGILYRNSSMRFRDITDGTSNTILAGERASRHQFDSNNPSMSVDANSTWYAAIPGIAARSAGMMMMPAMTEASPSLIPGHVGQPAIMGMIRCITCTITRITSCIFQAGTWADLTSCWLTDTSCF